VEPRIQYAQTKDGVNIAFAVLGQGPPLLWCPDLPNTHLQLEWHNPGHRAIYELLMRGRTLIRFDPRGHGLSDRKIDDFSLDKRLLDMLAVVDGLCLKQFDLFTCCRGGPLAVTYAFRYPKRVSHLILMNTFAAARERLETPRRVLDEYLDQDWVLFTENVSAYALGWGDEATRYAEFMRACVTHETAKVIYRAIDKDDVGTLLPQIRTPTLVIQHDGLRDWTVEMGRNLAARIKDAHLVVIKGKWFDNLDGVANAIDEFLAPRMPAKPKRPKSAKQKKGKAAEPSGLVSILFTDVEGSTALTQRLGDAKARDLLRQHERMVREALKGHGGSELKTIGDGFMASFSSAVRALESAIAMQRAFAAHNESADEPILVRVGLNAGEPIAEDEDLFGTAVNLAARITAVAKGGEILASEAVRQIVAGKKFLFSDRGETVLRGFEDPVHIYEVSWREEDS
jgi:class 3 adenylate cyclase/pimeloyl-ACP methyl ester carboxylesterase